MKSNDWNLYWVESDGIEDCFVAAQNSRSACRVEMDMNGFGRDEVQAKKIMKISKEIALSYAHSDPDKWPGYVFGKDFFESIGAIFRRFDDKEEMLLNDTVYLIEEYAPCGIHKIRVIGAAAVSEIKKISALLENEYDTDDDLWNSPQIHLITALGMCLAHCHQIEYYISNSFLLAISKKQKQKYKTIADLRKGWKKKTLGNMLLCIEESWDIHPIVKESLEIFLLNRNRLIHGITKDEKYDINTYWGQQELLPFLAFFDLHARIVKKSFRAIYHASIEFAIKNFGSPIEIPELWLKPEHSAEIDLFFEFFKVKEGCI